MEPLISVLKGCKKHREIILDIFCGVFNAKNQPKIRRPSPSVTPRAKKNLFAERTFNVSTSKKHPL